MSRVFILTPVSRPRAVAFVQDAPEGFVVKVSEPKKSRLQEEKYHAMIGDIAEQYTHCGRKVESESMKRLLIDQFKRDTINDPDLADDWKAMGAIEMMPSLDGSGVVMLGTQSRKFSRKLARAFVDWLYAFGGDCEPQIVWSDPMIDRTREAA